MPAPSSFPPDDCAPDPGSVPLLPINGAVPQPLNHGGKRRATQLDVARVAGVHNATVSLALRNSPSISEKTRKRIQTIAAELGYQPDPALRALAAYRRRLSTGRKTETIAYVTNEGSRWGWRELPAESQYHLGAQRKAEEYGYQLEHFWLSEPGMTPRRLSNMLFHRGITGLLLAAHRPGGDEPLDFDWPRFGAVKIGSLPHAPALHRVTSDWCGNIRLAMRRAVAAGYRRPGLVLPRWWDDRVDQALSLGFITEQNRLPAEDRIPIFFGPLSPFATRERHRPVSEPSAGPSFSGWIDEYQPDVVLGSFAHISSALSALGIATPAAVAFVDPFNGSPEGGVAGVRHNLERVGEIAVELLVAQLQQNLLGLPPIPATTLVEGAWCDGTSLPSTRETACA
jgi:LacI family transcriptional regulator